MCFLYFLKSWDLSGIACSQKRFNLAQISMIAFYLYNSKLFFSIDTLYIVLQYKKNSKKKCYCLCLIHESIWNQ